MKKLTVDNLQKLIDTLKEHDTTTKSIIILFTGSKDASNISWCPDCNVADPIIETITGDPKYDNDDYLLITAYVGQRDTWKNPQNPYRIHKDFRIKCVPTLLKWKTSLRLEESQCGDDEMISMLLED